MSINICSTCGLPVKACNAFARYRDVTKYLKLGRENDAAHAAESGDEWYEKFMAEKSASCDT